MAATAHNAFTTTDLQQILTERGIRSLVTCGIRTEQCVETTTRPAADRLRGDLRQRRHREDVPTAQGVALRTDPMLPAPGADDMVVVPGRRWSRARAVGFQDARMLRRLRARTAAPAFTDRRSPPARAARGS